jgi:hypothetical protein
MRRAARRLGAAVAAGLTLTAAAPAERPAYELGADRTLVVSLPADVLSQSEVKPRLTSGLTTSLVLQVTAADGRGHKARGGGLVEVRYELWDEVFLVTAVGSDGRRRRESLASLERLAAWWQALRLPVLPAGNRLAAGSWRIDTELTVIPFSRSEQTETQTWLSRSLSGEVASSAHASEAAGAAAPAGGVLDMLVATSIKRPSLVSFSWRTDLAVAPASGPSGGAGAAAHRPETAGGAPP